MASLTNMVGTQSTGDGDHVDVESDDDEDGGEDTDAAIRANNAYPGASNSIGSVHQRRWYLSLDRVGSGFVKRGGGWVRRDAEARAKQEGEGRGFEPFFVMGREEERSVLTGRLGGDVLKDEGVEGFVCRKGWKAVTE